MKKYWLSILACICALGMTACGDRTAQGQTESESLSAEQVQESESSDMNSAAESNLSGDGISGVYEMTREEESTEPADGELTYAEMLDKFYERHYSGMAPEELEIFINLRADYYRASAYHDEVVNYWENIREVRDVANVLEPLYYTDMKYYTEEDFAGDPPIIIHLAKNEIYARWGYIFKNEDLQNYFMGCAWYEPLYTAEEFDTFVFNDYEWKNLELLAELDTQ